MPCSYRAQDAPEVSELEDRQSGATLQEATKGLAEFVARVLESGLGVGGTQKVCTSHHHPTSLERIGKVSC